MFRKKNNKKETTKQNKKTSTPKFLPPPQIGIALGSGLARGFAHIGVIRALKRHGITPTIVSGTSMGALIGGAHLAGKLDEVEDWACSLNRLKILSYLDFHVRGGGIISGRRLLKLMHKHFEDMQVEDLPYPFISISTDLTTGHEVWVRSGKLVDVMRASFSLPGVFPPVFMNNRWLIDGALVNPVPVSPCQALGARMTIAVNPNGDLIGKAANPSDQVPKIAGFDILDEDDKNPEVHKAKTMPLTQRIFSRKKHSPSMFGTMVSAMNIAQDRLARSRLAGDPPDVLISPRIGHIGLMEFDRAEELIDEGEEAVERALPDIKAAYTVLCTHYTE